MLFCSISQCVMCYVIQWVLYVTCCAMYCIAAMCSNMCSLYGYSTLTFCLGSRQPTDHVQGSVTVTITNNGLSNSSTG